MNNFISRFFLSIYFVCTVVMFAAFILVALEAVDLTFPARIRSPTEYEEIGRFLIFISYVAIMFWFCCDTSTAKKIVFTLIYVPIHFIVDGLLPIGIFVTTICPISFCILILTVSGQKVRITIKRIIEFSAVCVLAQIQASFVRENLIFVNHVEIEMLSILFITLDVFALVFTKQKAGEIYGLVFRIFRRRLGGKHVLSSEEKSVRKNEGSGDALNLDDMTPRQKFKFFCMVAAFQIAQLVAVLAIGAINSMFVEVVLMLASFWIFRFVLRTSWHSESLSRCSLVTFASFFVMSRTALPMELSLFSGILVAAIFTYILYRIGTATEHVDNIEQKYEESINRIAELERTAVPDFSQYGFTAETAQIAYEWKVLGLKHKQILERHPEISSASLTKRKTRINQALKKSNVQ